MLIWAAYALLWVAALAYAVGAKYGKRLAGRVGTGATAAGWGLLAAGLIERARTAGHWPLTNRYEFALCLAWTILSLYLLLEITWRERRAGTFALAIALLAATYAVTRPLADQAITPLLPALRSAWLQIHVLSALGGYGAFGLAAGLGLAQLLQGRLLLQPPPEDKNIESGGGSASLRSGVQTGAASTKADAAHLHQFPDIKAGPWMERAVMWGFPWLTFSILSGAIWAQNAWGRYWGWDPKETWALITWLWYLMILHARSLRGWRGRRLAGLVVAGLGIVIFTFIGVPWLVRTVRLESLHGF